MKKLLGLLMATGLFTSLTAQVELIKQQPQALNGKGKIYALIVGISDYDNIRDLTYAHRDAEDFYHFLVHESGLGVDSNNIRKLTNKQATAANFGRELLKLKNKMDEGSTFFIYFAGHGDANGEAQAFLLASDLPKIEDPGLYAFTPGVIHVYNLKDEIRKIISDKKSQVVLVTDACRTNELAGSKAGAQTYVAKIMEQNNGEIQFISCAADEKSEESTKWGQGRGVFSYYFMNGLRGLADTRPADGKVTVRELFDYVQKNVEDATAITDAESADMAGKAYRQSPQYCCTEKQGVALVLVNEKLKQETIAKMAMENAAPSLASNAGRNAMRFIETKDSALKQLYDKFYVALDNNKLVSPTGHSAWDYYKMLEAKAGKNAPWMFDAKEDMKAALLNDAQGIISAFYSYTDKWGMSDKTKRNFYFEGVDKLRKARSLMAKDDPMSPIVKMTRQCMEAAGYFASSQPEDWKRGIKIMDSAIAYSPKNPLPVFLKGRLFYNLRQHDSAMEYMHHAQHLAPLWSMPRIGMADIYMDTEQYDSAETILLEVAKKHQIALVYFKLGFFYGDHMNDAETAVFYSKAAHALAPEKTNIINNIGVYYERLGQYDSALHYYELSYSVDSNNAFTLKNMGLLFLNDYYDYTSAEKILEMALGADSTEGTVYESLGILYAKQSENTSLRLGERLEYWKKSVAMYEKAVAYKPTESYMYIAKAKVEAEVDIALAEKTMQKYLQYGKANADYYNELGLVYQDGGATEKAVEAFYKGLAVDSNYYYPLYNLGIHYFDNKQWDSAVKYLSRAYEVDPKINYIYYKITEAENNLEEIKRTEQTEILKQELLQRVNSGDKESLLELAEIYYNRYNYDSAYQYYTQYIDYNPGCAATVYTAYLFSARNIDYTEYWYNYHGNTSPGETYLTALGRVGQQAVKRKQGSMAYLYIEAVSSARLVDNLPLCEQVYQAVQQGDPGYEYTADLAAFIAKLYDYSYNQEKALEWLEIALEKGYSVEYAAYYSNFESLQGNKKYQKLLKKYRKKQGIKEPAREDWDDNNTR